MSRSKHKKLYYVPGLVSLILVPLLFVYFGKREIQKLDVRVIEMNFWHPKLSEHWSFPERNFKQIVLTGNAVKDKAAIENAELLIKSIYADGDIINGIQLTFSDSASYASYISVLNFFKKEDIRHFIAYENNLWVVNTRPKKITGTTSTIEPILFNCILYPSPSSTENQASFTTLFYSFFRSNLEGIKRIWPTIALLFLLITVTITQLLRSIKPTIV